MRNESVLGSDVSRIMKHRKSASSSAFGLLCAMLGLAFTTGGCGGTGEDGDDSCSPGRQDCACLPNDTCLGGLACGPAGRCVQDPGGSGGSGGDGGGGGETTFCGLHLD